MAPTPHTTALALRCRPAGTIIEVTWDELGITPRAAPGKPFSTLVAASGMRKAARFLRTIQASHIALDWELDVVLPHGVAPYFFSGCAIDRSFLVFATKAALSETSVPLGVARLAGTSADQAACALAELGARVEAKAASEHALAQQLSRLKDALVIARQPAAKSRPNRKAGARQMQLLQMAAHDLRNPISGVLAAAEYLLDDAAQVLEEHHLAVLKSIESSSRLILRLTEEMLEIPSRASKQSRLELQSTSIVSLVEQGIRENRGLAGARHVQIDLKVEEPAPLLQVDQLKMHRAIQDLITSSISSSRSGSLIEIRISQRAGNVVISLHEREADPAMPIAAPPADAEASHGPQGAVADPSAALTLASIKRIVERHHGAMQVENRKPAGRAFTLSLPLNPGAAPARRRTRAS